MIKAKIVDPKKPESELLFQITQKDGVIKSLKKEISQLKSQAAKSKREITGSKMRSPFLARNLDTFFGDRVPLPGVAKTVSLFKHFLAHSHL